MMTRLLVISYYSRIRFWQLSNNQLKNGFWSFIDNVEDDVFNIKSLQQEYREFSSISSVFNFWYHNALFCIKYKLYEKCSFCSPTPKETVNYLPLLLLSLKNL